MRTCTMVGAALGWTPFLAAKTSGPAQHMFSLDRGWLFGGKLNAAALEPAFDDAAFRELPCRTAAWIAGG